jgi:hypothetical protein
MKPTSRFNLTISREDNREFTHARSLRPLQREQPLPGPSHVAACFFGLLKRLPLTPQRRFAA